ncbi:polysaccharide biosynthesis protein [Cyclobacterium sp. SYSU L10401]|uniref:polysaccharide biosynthesis protein n=1 Tax=Cyclobacterium sp. SYSU L10401 TaxID=2678657 RepID=UPI0013D309BB|nr:nucleoside-diphosphate sugar epimerase/dehydratase [Cyclobacterium sp. SYSU L10401]
MIDFKKKINIVPRWIIASLDGLIMFQSALLAFWLRVNFDWSDMEHFNVFRGALVYFLAGLLAMFFTKSYVGIVRHTSMRDGLILLRTIAITAGIITILNLILANFLEGRSHIVPFSVLIIAAVLTSFSLMLYRLIVKDIFRLLRSNAEPNLPRRKVVIYGAGEAGILTHQAIAKDSQYKFVTYGFLDDDPSKKGMKIEGRSVHGSLEVLEDLVKRKGINELIISILELPAERKREIIDQCIALGIHVMTITPVNQWVDGGKQPGSLREVNIEDLLGRDAIILNNKRVINYLNGKTILVTGAAGSIGSELCRQIARASPGFLIMLDIAESPLHDHEIRMEREFKDLRLHSVLGDVTDIKSLRRIMENYQPEVIFHAAAYKHVPMMEKYPEASVRCNVLGTKNMADLAVAYGVEKFVLVSTDKAVNPTNVMGASKRIAEMYVQCKNSMRINTSNEPTRFITTRFGNVLGSNGSVIPLFREQIKNGEPVTVTDSRITRYFMTIPEACDLVLEAGVMGNGGEIFVFDMGNPVKIIDLARKMIHLSGKIPDVDVPIRITGLRPGEKLYEEVLNDAEKALETHHKKIKIAQVNPGSYAQVNREVDLLMNLVERENEMDLVAQMKKMVPEYISKMSRFEVLDGQKVEK